jgi:hypothetical protein
MQTRAHVDVGAGVGVSVGEGVGVDVGAGVGVVLGTTVLHRTIAHSAQPWFAAPLIYQSIPKHGSRKSMSRCPSLMGHLGVAVLGVAVLGTAVLGVAVLGTAVLGVVLGTAVQLLPVTMSVTE